MKTSWTGRSWRGAPSGDRLGMQNGFVLLQRRHQAAGRPPFLNQDSVYLGVYTHGQRSPARSCVTKYLRNPPGASRTRLVKRLLGRTTESSAQWVFGHCEGKTLICSGLDSASCKPVARKARYCVLGKRFFTFFYAAGNRAGVAGWRRYRQLETMWPVGDYADDWPVGKAKS